MSRSLSIALIFLGSAIITSLFWLHSHLMARQHEAFFASSTDITEVTIAQKIWTLNFSLRLTEERLAEEWQRERFSELIDIVKHAQQVRDRLNEQILSGGLRTNQETTNSPSSKQFSQFCNYELLRFKASVTALIDRKQEEYDLSSFHSEELLKEINEVHSTSLPPATESFSMKHSALELRLCFLSFLNAQEEILQRLIQITGSKADHIDSYFPIINGSPQYPKVGELHTTLVSVGTYCDRLARAEVLLIVGHDTLVPGPDGKAKYELRPQRRGLHSLPTKCIVTNPFTGEVRTGEGTYTYRAY
ncbi:MAG: hypothetical protein AB8H12_15755 [Lewinella sp.]